MARGWRALLLAAMWGVACGSMAQAAGTPEARFTAQPTAGAPPLTVQFTDQSTNAPTSWSWDFGDGGTSTQQSPSHTYAAEGSYTVVLGVANASGTAVLMRSGYITVTAVVTAPPVASFTVAPNSGDAPLTVQFTDTSTNSPTAWAWDFGDGTTGSEQSPEHTYAQAGTYTVALAASNVLGTGLKVSPGCVTVTGAAAPVADFSASPTSGEAPLTVTFTDASTNAPTSWQWTFGDGGSATEQNPTHTYTMSGTYPVKLETTNAAGSDSVTKADYITVQPTALRADFTASPTSGEPPLAVTFTDTSTFSGSIWSWDFGDGGTSSEQNPTHVYSAVGSYTVTHTVFLEGVTRTVTKPAFIVVAEPVTANFTGEPLRGPAPLLVRFTDLSRNGPTTWRWDFGDGTTATEQNPEHEFTAPGEYLVELTTVNAAGAATVKRIVTVTQTEGVNFSGTPVSGLVPLTVHFTDLSGNAPALWVWDFGDGGTEAQQNPSHEYTRPGRHTVTLTTVAGGVPGSLTREHYVLASFRDVPLGYWAIDPILACAEAGIATGYSDGSYHPGEAVTRAEMAAYLARALAEGAVPEGPATPSFADVPADHWAYPYIEYVKAREVVEGYADGYHPEEPVNRGQLAVYIARARADGEAGVPAFTGTPSFDDVTAANEWAWALKYVEYARSQGIVSGYGDGRYHPEYEVTRDQLAVYLARTFGLE